ncbi:hypothetical protein GCM10011613_07800 [Cellvibrio zantedeschiae]|uniref:TonB C-terminal domain-containing protein n=1 Tax=Cellvibrio zantedeschiae TaxID=1237077 RepID=A0ABQ3ATJ0_9GAMM|nr:energy transducer TonB [Cellvibrio zantedeschiae]GGY66317.1 hypothetical protein GCM10011613_07800 [Cellvibrio zantedeschiae]
MSYHVQQNTQQRSLGIFIVIAFHLLLIWALTTGLAQRIINVLPLVPLKVAPIEEKVTPPPPIDVPKPNVDNKTQIIVDTNLPVVDFASDTGPQVIKRGGGDIIQTATMSKPRLIRATKPDYPLAASRLGEQGASGLRFLVNTDGSLSNVELVTSSGSSRLDEAAIKHAKRNWAFTPCMENEKAVPCWHQTKLVWRLEDAKR